MKTTAYSGIAAVLANSIHVAKGNTMATANYYNDGRFTNEQARDAYYALMKSFGYPIPDVLRTEQFWTCDFVQGDFLRLGMGGVFWINESDVYGESGSGNYDGKFKDENFGYLGHDIYLLPGQTLPEHRHVGGAEGHGPKMESWQVRHGEVNFYGEYKGAGDEIPVGDLPEDERPWGYGEDWFKSKYVAKRTAKSGKLYTLKDPESWHGQRAGKNGAIVTEYATFHNHVAFSKPDMVFGNTGQQ